MQFWSGSDTSSASGRLGSDFKLAKAKAKSLYDVHPGVAMVQKWIGELKQKSGRSLEEWTVLVKKKGPKDEKSQREWLKIEHKLGTNSACWIAARAAGKEPD